MYTNKENKGLLKAEDIPESSSIRGIRYLTCQGGGMKAIGELGAIERLEELGVLAQIEEVAGSSAGGLMATLLAVGYTAEELKLEMLKVNFRAFQDKSERGWVEASGLADVSKDTGKIADEFNEKLDRLKKIPVVGEVAYHAIPYLSLIRNAGRILRGAHKIIKGVEVVENVGGLAFGKNLGLWTGDSLRYWLANLIARKTGNPNITFEELAKLTELPGSPFKKLTLTGSNLTTGKPEYYNARHTPNMSILEAARISASFPGAYRPIVTEDQAGNRVVRVDGGLLENLPDVFHKPPYITEEELNAHGGNPRAFALALVAPGADKPKDIQGIFSMGKAAFDAKMSEEPWYEKYGANVARISTVDMGTLEYKASNEKKARLVHAGRKAVDNAFVNMLGLQEQDLPLALVNMSLSELIRIEVALTQQLGKQPNKIILQQELGDVGLEVKNRKAAADVLQNLRMQEAKKLERKNKLLDEDALSDEELSQICFDKKAVLERLVDTLDEQLQDLRLAKKALILNKTELMARFKENQPRNTFYQDIQHLKSMADAVYIHQKTNVELDGAIVKIIEKYKLKSDTAMVEFFEDIREDSKKPGFRVPHNTYLMSKYCFEDVRLCQRYIDDIQAEKERTELDKKIFSNQSKILLSRGYRSQKFNALLHLKAELDKSIYRKTGLVAKINSFLMKKLPKFKKVVTFFMKGAALLSFMCLLPAAIPLVPLAKVIAWYKGSQEYRDVADRLLNFFKKTNIDEANSLRGLRSTTEAVVKILEKHMADSNQDPRALSQLFHLYDLFLKETGLDLKDIVIRQEGEKKGHYQQRLAEEKKKLEALVSCLEEGPRHHMFSEEKLEQFRNSVRISVQKVPEAHGKQMLPSKKAFIAQKEKEYHTKHGKLPLYTQHAKKPSPKKER